MEEVPTTEEIRERWTSMGDWFQSHGEYMCLAIMQSFLPLLRLQEAQSILEVGCGTGKGAKAIKEFTSQELTCCDLTPYMIETATQRNLTGVNFLVANNESLPFPDAKFDRYIANLSLHIVESPETMLSEAYRVLKPNSIAAFSVWGRKEYHTFFGMIGRTMKELEIELPAKKRSQFHLEDQEKLKALIKDAGFSNLLTYYVGVPVNLLNAEEAKKFYETMPQLDGVKKLGEDKFQQFLHKLHQNIEETFSQEKPLIFEGLVAIAVKL